MRHGLERLGTWHLGPQGATRSHSGPTVCRNAEWMGKIISPEGRARCLSAQSPRFSKDEDLASAPARLAQRQGLQRGGNHHKATITRQSPWRVPRGGISKPSITELLPVRAVGQMTPAPTPQRSHPLSAQLLAPSKPCPRRLFQASRDKQGSPGFRQMNRGKE